MAEDKIAAVPIYTAASEYALTGKKPPGLGSAIVGVLISWSKGIAKSFIKDTKQPIIDDVKTEVAVKSLDPEMFQTAEIKDAVVKLKEQFKSSPDTISDLGGDIFNVIIGKAAQVQLEGVTGKKVDKEMPLTVALFTQMAIVTDITLLSNILSVIGQCIPFTQLTDLGRELRSYLDYSGLTQITGFGYGMLLSAALAPKLTQEIDNKMLNTPLEARDIINLEFRDYWDVGRFDDRMALKGYNKPNAKHLKNAMRPLLDPRTLINLKHRQFITSEDFNKLMAGRGFTQSNIDFMLKEAQYFPTPAEVILWAAREVFEPEVREKLRLDEKFPEAFWEYAEKAGMTLEEAKNFWAAHWVFPGWTTIQEMRWRNIITDDDVEVFFTEADIVPFWRDAMKEVMYSPYTRVDGRRMYETGILSREQFKTAMTDIGYTDERAEGLAKWATDRKLAPQKDLTMSKIEKAFRDGEIDATNFTQRIIDMGYDSEEATLILNLLKRDIEEKEEKDKIDWYILRFKNGLINLDELTKFLDGLGLNEAKKNKLIIQAKNAKASLAKTASKSDLDKWYKQNIIKQETYKARLEALGYEEGDINNYVASINLEIGGET